MAIAPYDEQDDEDGIRRRALMDQLAPEEEPAAPTYRVQGAPVRGDEGTLRGDTINHDTSGSRDQALQQVSQVYGQSAQINAANPTAEAGLPYVQAGNTGGYLDGVGVTIRPGSSITPQQQERNIAAALAAGVPQSFIDSFGGRNLGDSNRIVEAYNSQQTGVQGGGSGGGGGTSQYSSGGSGGAGGQGGSAESGLQAFLAMLQSDRQRQETERAGLREILMSQLSGLQSPVSLDTPGIREAVSGHRLGLQRSGEDMRQEAAERRAYEGYGPNSAQFGQDAERIAQHQGESAAQFQGNVLLQEHQQRQQRLQQLLATALAMGDSESARNIQAQLASLGQQQQNSQFYSGLNQNQNQFEDRMGYDWAALQQGGNAAALAALLGI
jgi:hypothetical protein